MALVRPEQLRLSTDMGGNGLRATVVRTQFHGHDKVITVAAHNADETPITIRSDGGLPMDSGTEVEVTADGSAATWPRSELN